MTKLFDTRELPACINALLHRHEAQIDEDTLDNTSPDLSF